MVERKGHGTMLIDPGDVICIFMVLVLLLAVKKQKKKKNKKKKTLSFLDLFISFLV